MNGRLSIIPLGVLSFAAACEALSPSAVGTIEGRVAIEGQGTGGVAVSLSSGAAMATAPDGSYRFYPVERGSHTVSISGYPLDATFGATTASAEIVSDGQTVMVDFRGEYIRTASLMGRVSIEGRSVAGVSVRLEGMSEGLTATDDAGHFAFQSLRAGSYSVSISGFGPAEFPTTAQSVSLAVGESKVLSFEGTYIRRSSIAVAVSVESEGLPGVTLDLAGEDETARGVTDPEGRHTFARLRAGTYTLEISGFDSDEVEFPTTTDTVKIGVDETKRIAFDGRHVRTASISGLVTVETLGLGGVTVRLSGVSDTTATTTDNKGQYAIAGLQRGIYEVAISGYDYQEIGFSNTSEVVTLQTGESKIVSFDGTYLRTAGIQGQVSVGGEGLQGVTVSLAGGPDDVSETTTTDASGQYSFTRLRAGDYAVGISGYDTEKYEFEVTSQNVTVVLGETAYVPFQGVRVPPDISGKYALVSIKALVTGGQVMMPPVVTGTFSLEQSRRSGIKRGAECRWTSLSRMDLGERRASSTPAPTPCVATELGSRWGTWFRPKGRIRSSTTC